MSHLEVLFTTKEQESIKDCLDDFGNWICGSSGSNLGWINVFSFGVLPSNSAATNSANIIAATTAACGGTLFFPPGIYLFDEPITIVCDLGMTIMGSGMGNTETNAAAGGTIIRAAGPFTALIYNANNRSTLTMHDIGFMLDVGASGPELLGNFSGDPTPGGYPNPNANIYNVSVRSADVLNPGINGIVFTNGNFVQIGDINIFGLSGDSVRYVPANCDNSSFVLGGTNSIFGAGNAGSRGVVVQGGGMQVTGTYIFQTQIGVEVSWPSCAQGTTQAIVTGNDIFLGGVDDSIAVKIDPHPGMGNVTVSGNALLGKISCVQFPQSNDDSQSIINASITGNNCITDQPNSIGFDISNSKFSVVSSNQVGANVAASNNAFVGMPFAGPFTSEGTNTVAYTQVTPFFGNYGLMTNTPFVGQKFAQQRTNVGSNADLFYTAVTPGAGGNAIHVAYVNDGPATPLSVSVVGTIITVHLQTNGGGTPISTASQIRTAVLASGPAAALVGVTLAPGNNGSGTPPVLAIDLSRGQQILYRLIHDSPGIDFTRLSTLIATPGSTVVCDDCQATNPCIGGGSTPIVASWRHGTWECGSGGIVGVTDEVAVFSSTGTLTGFSDLTFNAARSYFQSFSSGVVVTNPNNVRAIFATGFDGALNGTGGQILSSTFLDATSTTVTPVGGDSSRLLVGVGGATIGRASGIIALGNDGATFTNTDDAMAAATFHTVFTDSLRGVTLASVNPSIIKADSSAIIGTNTGTITGTGAFSQGNAVIVGGSGGAISATTLSRGNAVIIGGTNGTITDVSNAVSINGGAVTTSDTTAISGRIFNVDPVSTNDVSGVTDATLVAGFGNTLVGGPNSVIGGLNSVNGASNYVFGESNIGSGSNNIYIGFTIDSVASSNNQGVGRVLTFSGAGNSLFGANLDDGGHTDVSLVGQALVTTTNDTAIFGSNVNTTGSSTAQSVILSYNGLAGSGSYVVSKVGQLSLGVTAFSGTPEVIITSNAVSTHATLDIKRFGATGDGSTDDTTAIQSVIDSAATTGAEILCSPGEYKTSAALTIVKPVKIRGTRGFSPSTTMSGCRIVASNATQNIFSVDLPSTNAYDQQGGAFVLEDLTLDSSVTKSAGGGIHVTNSHSGCSTLLLNRVSIFNQWDGVNGDNQCQSVFTNVRITKFLNMGLHLESVNRYDEGLFTVFGSEIASIAASSKSAIEWKSGGGLYVSSNTLVALGTAGIDLTLSTGVATSQIAISDNEIEGAPIDININATGAATSLLRTTITGNVMTCLGTGCSGVTITASGGGLVDQVSITGNSFQGDNGVHVASGNHIAIGNNDFRTNVNGILVDAAAGIVRIGENSIHPDSGVVFSIANTTTSIVGWYGIAFTGLPTPQNGSRLWCSDCDPTATLLTCTHVGAQTGAMAVRSAGGWKCIG